MAESCLLTGPLEPTNQWYAIAKIAGIKLTQAYRRQHGADFISAMPTNLYGPFDNFDLATSHVVPALMRKMHDAKLRDASEVEVWGTGTPRRELLYVDDLADACVHLLEHYSGEEHVNVGSGTTSLSASWRRRWPRSWASRANLRFDPSRPDGAPRKLLDVGKLQHWAGRRAPASRKDCAGPTTGSLPMAGGELGAGVSVTIRGNRRETTGRSR